VIFEAVLSTLGKDESMNKVATIAFAAAMLLFAGCGEKKCFFVSQDGKSVQPGAPVVWYDAYVGKVDAVESVEAGSKVTIRLDKKYAEEIHDGVAGRVVNDPDISQKSFVLLVGGRDKERPLVSAGAQIPESKPTNVVSEGFSAFVDWLRNSRADELKIVGVALLILFVLLKFVSKMLKFVLFVGILGAIAYVCVSASVGWDSYKEQLSSAQKTAQEAKAWLQQHGEKLHAVLETALEASD